MRGKVPPNPHRTIPLPAASFSYSRRLRWAEWLCVRFNRASLLALLLERPAMVGSFRCAIIHTMSTHTLPVANVGSGGSIWSRFPFQLFAAQRNLSNQLHQQHPKRCLNRPPRGLSHRLQEMEHPIPICKLASGARAGEGANRQRSPLVRVAQCVWCQWCVSR